MTTTLRSQPLLAAAVLLASVRLAAPMGTKHRFSPTAGQDGKLLATQPGRLCTKDYYHPSQLEIGYHRHVLNWTDEDHLCAKLSAFSSEWIGRNEAGGDAGPLFSRMCRRGQPEKVLEPLAGILRDPRALCSADANFDAISSIEWLVLDDDRIGKLTRPGAKRYFFDAGGSRFMDAMQYFATAYQKRGILFDEAFVWEAARQDPEAYWEGVPADIRAFWEPRVTFHNGVPVVSTPGDWNNPVDRIKTLCRAEDFCAFKLDIDTPEVELPITKQLLDDREGIADVLDEFFFEHHVHGLMEGFGWGDRVAGTYADSYDIFTKLRQLGIRAHSWI